MDLGDQIAAMRAFEEARTLTPDLGEIYLRIGEVELVQGSAKDAIASAEKSLRMQPTLLEAHGVLGRAYEELADIKAAR
ncbi:MAG: hypothetical protein MUC50_22780, partial [Myxococcota bacterium]|nr:hypothetical protein [Myxococcota bacterium]